MAPEFPEALAASRREKCLRPPVTDGEMRRFVTRGSRRMPSIDWGKMVVEEEGVVALTPCLSLVLYLEEVDEEGVLDFYERSLSALGDQLSYCQYGNMRARKKLDQRGRSAVPSWKGKMTKPLPDLFAVFYGNKRGVSPTELYLYVNTEPYASSDARAATKAKAELKANFAKFGDDLAVMGSAELRVTFPVDHPMAEDPSKLLGWVEGLRLVREGAFISGCCGYGLNDDETEPDFIYVTERMIRKLCMRHPGLDVRLPFTAAQLLSYTPERILHGLCRVNWLTLISGNCVEQLGGLQQLMRALGKGPAQVHPLRRGAALIQACPSPGLGDRARRDLLPGYQQVARALRPIRTDSLTEGPQGTSEDWVQEWLDAFDKEGGR